DRIIIFGRYPEPGQTKTRLIPLLGPAGTAELQRKLTEKTFNTVKAFASDRVIEVKFRYEGGSDRKMVRWLGSGMIFSRQNPGDLGERMQTAFLEAFHTGCRRVVLLGTDIPELKIDHLEQAFDALIEHDLVLGPSTDGGYWLMGLNRSADLFHGINWGTETVLDQTIALAKGQGLRTHRLDPLTDIDTVEDLKQSLPGLAAEGPYMSVIIPVLNEAANVEKTINRTQDDDVEVIVVDGGSIDDTISKAKRAGARVKKSFPGRAVQQNHGASVARGSVLLFLHSDTALPSGYVAQVFDTLMDPQISLGAFRFKTDLNRPLMKVIEFVTNIRSHYLKLPYGDQGLFIRKSVFDSVGGFPEVPIAEDLIFVRRLSKYGRIGIAPAYAITSARRWKTLGLLRTTLINQVILAGCCLGISPLTLEQLYRITRKK
ncbi:MAG: TIGR04283 family arsenosugar biosynthesis glycosyltransferase, partial [Desulfobacteraceae bacterium]